MNSTHQSSTPAMLRPLPSRQGHQLLGDWPEQDNSVLPRGQRRAEELRVLGVSGVCIWSSVNVYN